LYVQAKDELEGILSTKVNTSPREETVEEFLARGGRIERVEDHPLPDGRVLLRGQRERQQQLPPAHST
jgi:hypothetical protein